MTFQRFRRFLPLVLDQRTACRSITSFTFLVLILTCLPALSSAQQTCQPDGDVNQNGSVTAVDALLAFQQALSLIQLDACQLSIADVFPSPHAPDGSVTASDALCIFQKALGSPSCFDILPPSNPPPMVSAGADHTCGILDTGAVACWGLDDDGQSTPPAGTFTTVSAGADHTCGILATGAVACWGLDDAGQSTPPAGTFTTISAGGDHTCGILDTGAVACWGLDDDGQSTPPAGTFTMVSAGGDHTCGILDTSAVACWGLDDDGQSTPPAGTFTTISVGADHTCGILDTGAVACWGLDDDGQSTPPAGTFTTISAGADHTCGILDMGAVTCWGLDGDGQSMPPAGTFTTISAGADHTCGILDTGAVTCWGLDDDGQSMPPAGTLTTVGAGGDHTCGILDTGAVTCWGLDGDGQSTPPAGTFTTISAGADHTCGILDTGAVTCWGLDDDGQSTPPAGTFTTISVGGDHTCGILDTGAVACWGLDDDGQSTPPAGTFTTISAGADHTCGILDTGAVACWGLDDDGQSTPPAGTFTTISAGGDHTCGILDTGAVACWGLDDDGQSTPPAGSFTTVSAGADHTCGILDTGAVACWGLDDDGQSTPPAGTFTTINAGWDHTCGILDTGAVACWGRDDDGQSAPPGRATAPDLVVASPSVSDSSPDAGAFFTFTLSATVRNEGDGASAAITLRYYRSTDATITTSDTAVGTDAVAGLAASGTSEQAISLTAPSTPGTYYYGVCVDAVTGESDTTNNCSASVQVTVPEPERPDLEVGTPTVDDARPETGATFTLSATVSNTGDGESSATTLHYYRSTDATITTLDTEEGTAAVGVLSASGTSGQSISLTAPATAATYYYGACVDAVSGESDTTNNCSASVKVDVEEPPKYPDLEVGTPTVDDTTPETGASFTLSATVSNAGDGESSATTLHYYRSTDATITTSGTEEGTAAVGVLSASGTSDESISLTAPATAATYYYGVCVDTVAGESDTTNNCSASVKVDVEEPPTYPDLEVGTPTVDDTTPETGGAFTLSATVSNQGDGESVATTLHYYRSTDATITTSDTQVGTDEVGTLSASGTSAQSISLTAPATAATYYYGACVDAVSEESDTTNNCSASVKVDVEEPPTYPDLEVGRPTVSDTTPETEASFTLSATVSNTGDGEAPATTLRYYRSTDATITTSDTEVGTDAVGALAAAGTSSESISLTAPATAGAYYYGACADTVTGESDTTNNCSASVKVDVEEPPKYPDLEVGTPTVDDTTPETSASFTLSATVSNAGDGESSATTLRYYRSTDATITTSDTAVGTDTVGVLSASGSSPQSISLTAPAPGTYYYGACVDTVTGESDTTDNCSSSVQVTVREPEPAKVEVTPGEVTLASLGDTAALTARVLDAQGNEIVGEAVSWSSVSPEVATVDAAGVVTAVANGIATVTASTSGVSSAATVTVWQRASSAAIDPGEVELTSVGETATVTLRAFDANGHEAPGGGDLISWAWRSADPNVATVSPVPVITLEAEVQAVAAGTTTVTVTTVTEDGGTLIGTATVTVRQPDLRIVGVVAGTPLDGVFPGTRIQFSASVRNYGDANSDATTLRYYRSTDATISGSDTEVGTDEVSALVPSEQVSEGIDLTAPSSTGAYYYGACVDAVTDESDTTNNCSASVKVDVEEPPKYPDLEVGTPKVDDETPETEASFTLSATVSNTGDGESPATTLRYYRSTDATITTSDTEVGTDAVGVLSVSGSSEQSISLTAPATAATYYYGACVDTVTGESDTTNNCSAWVKVDVEEPPTYPDLEVGRPTVSDTTPQTGGAFTLSATVSNTGDGASAATTLRYYRSTDATITTSNTEVGTDAVGVLSVSGSSEQSISLTAPSTLGPYYYGACVDTVTDESDTTDNCSAWVKVDVEAPPKYPDLVVGTPTVDDATPETEASFTLSATVSNTGDGEAPATTLRYYRSTDATITTSDTEVGTDAVGALAAAGTSSESISLTAPATAGAYYYGACVDTVTGESDTTNNCSASVKVDVEEPPTYPDLEVGTPTVDDTTPETSASFTLSATVSNAGDGESGRQRCGTTARRTRRSRRPTRRWARTRLGRLPLRGPAASRSR